MRQFATLSSSSIPRDSKKCEFCAWYILLVSLLLSILLEKPPLPQIIVNRHVSVGRDVQNRLAGRSRKRGGTGRSALSVQGASIQTPIRLRWEKIEGQAVDPDQAVSQKRSLSWT
jgi:hypothetical protein